MQIPIRLLSTVSYTILNINGFDVQYRVRFWVQVQLPDDFKCNLGYLLGIVRGVVLLQEGKYNFRYDFKYGSKYDSGYDSSTVSKTRSYMKM